MSRHAKFRQSDITRAVRAASKVGLTIARTEIDPDGRIVLIHGSPHAAPENPFDAWKASRDAH